jgi:hypothetical protein
MLNYIVNSDNHCEEYSLSRTEDAEGAETFVIVVRASFVEASFVGVLFVGVLFVGVSFVGVSFYGTLSLCRSRRHSSQRH